MVMFPTYYICEAATSTWHKQYCQWYYFMKYSAGFLSNSGSPIKQRYESGHGVGEIDIRVVQCTSSTCMYDICVYEDSDDMDA